MPNLYYPPPGNHCACRRQAPVAAALQPRISGELSCKRLQYITLPHHHRREVSEIIDLLLAGARRVDRRSSNSWFCSLSTALWLEYSLVHAAATAKRSHTRLYCRTSAYLELRLPQDFSLKVCFCRIFALWLWFFKAYVSIILLF